MTYGDPGRDPHHPLTAGVHAKARNPVYHYGDEGDEYPGLSTSLLTQHAIRATPDHERHYWMSTDPESGFHDLHPDEQRRLVQEQLAEYGIDAAEINRRRA